MKKTISIFAAVILVSLAIPAIVGQYLKYEVSKRLEAQIWPNGYRIHINKYSAGWMSSHVNLTVNRGSNGAQAGGQVPLTITIYHGPLEWVKNLEGRQSLFFKLAILTGQLPFEGKFLNFMGFVTYSGHVIFESKEQNYNSIIKNDKETTVLNIAEIRSHTELSGHWQRLTGNISLNTLSAHNNEFSFTIPNVNASYDLEKISQALWLGQRQVEISLFNLAKDNKGLISLEQLVVAGNAKLENKLISLSAQTKIGKIIYLVNQNLGALSIDYYAKNYSPTKMEQLSELLASMNTEDKNGVQPQHNMQALLQGAITLLPGTTHKLSVVLNSPQGKATLNGNLDFPQAAQAISNPPLEALAVSLMTNAIANIEISVPISFLDNIVKQIGSSTLDLQNNIKMLEASGAIKVQSNSLFSQIQYQNTSLTINNIPLQKIIAQLKMPQTSPINSQPPSPTPLQTPNVLPNNNLSLSQLSNSALAKPKEPSTTLNGVTLKN